MRISELYISNFRGVEQADIVFPDDSNLFCMIGPGDSTKSTILCAIEWVFWPSYSLSVGESDFFDGDLDRPIVITADVADYPKQLLSSGKFGQYLRRPRVPLGEGDAAQNDNPDDDGQSVLTIRLTINGNMEPKWEVVGNKRSPKPISHVERRLFSVGNVGENCSKDLSWGRHSVLQKYGDPPGCVRTRTVWPSLRGVDLHEFDKADDEVLSVGKRFGVSFDNDINNRLQPRSDDALSGMISLFDGNVPLSQKGAGSQRLLSMGLNISRSKKDGILLIDEVERGLEPYRLCSLINVLRYECLESGQVIMTTHSPVVVAECDMSEIMIVRSENNRTDVQSPATGDKKADDAMRKELRRNPEAFLCRRLIVCEGKTELGFVRALDSYLFEKHGFRVAYAGVGAALGNGAGIVSCAETLKRCGYDVCVMMDSDIEDMDKKKRSLRDDGINVFDWDPGNAIEEQIFSDVPESVAERILDIAVEERGLDPVKKRLEEKGVACHEEDGRIRLLSTEAADMRSVGTAAKNSGKKDADGSVREDGWFKRIDLGESVGDVIFDSIDEINPGSRLRKVIDDLISWVGGYGSTESE